LPFTVAAGLLVLSLGQTVAIMNLLTESRHAQAQLAKARSAISVLEQSNALISLYLTSLEARDPAYAGGRVFIAWDAGMHRGSIALEEMPSTPAGRDYQLWILDPNAPGPLNAGVVKGGRTFDAGSVSMPRPGFALSLEPAGGSATLTGPILFAVAPAR
jgi:anti-sigma-K factor RskA